MDLIFGDIELRNYKTLKHVKYDFNSGLYIIRGLNDFDEGADSNGSGKSAAFIDGLTWCFTGYQSNGKRIDVYNPEQDVKTMVRVKFSIDGEWYILDRKYKDATELKLYKLPDEKKPFMDNKNKIEQFLKDNQLDLKMLTTIIFMSYRSPSTFMKDTPANRKLHIENLAGIEIVDEVSDLLSQLKSHYDARVNTIIELKSNLKGQIKVYEDQERDKVNADKLKEQLKKDQEEALKILAKHEVSTGDELKTYIEEQRKIFETKINKYIADRSDLNRKKSELDSEYAALNQDKCPYCEREWKDPKRMKEIEDILPKIKDKIEKVSTREKTVQGALQDLLIDVGVPEDLKRIDHEFGKLLEETKTLNTKVKIQQHLKRVEEKEIYFLDKTGKIKKFIGILGRKIKTILLTKYLSNLQAELEVFNSRFNVDVKLQQKTNDIRAYYNGKDYDNSSGGEGARCDIIIQSALRNSYKINTNLKIYDEIFDSLDKTGINQVLDFLGDIHSEDDCVFIISHNDNVNMSDAKELTIRKREDGFSYLEEDTNE